MTIITGVQAITRLITGALTALMATVELLIGGERVDQLPVLGAQGALGVQRHHPCLPPPPQLQQQVQQTRWQQRWQQQRKWQQEREEHWERAQAYPLPPLAPAAQR